MSEAKFTPGPWTATDPHKWLANTPRFKCSVRYGTTNLGNSIAEVYLGGPGALSADAESVNANARLIAAAPELYEALRGLMNLTDQGREGGLILSRGDRKPLTNGDQDVIDRAYIAADYAIRKARGEQ
jgi:hypothetical protein